MCCVYVFTIVKTFATHGGIIYTYTDSNPHICTYLDSLCNGSDLNGGVQLNTVTMYNITWPPCCCLRLPQGIFVSGVEQDVNNIAIYGFEVALKLMYICTRSTTYIYNQVSTYRSRSWQKAR